MRTDVLVVGGGSAGISAATWVARKFLEVALVDAGEQRNRWAREIHGYLALDVVAPLDLVESAASWLKRYPQVTQLSDRVASIVATGDGFQAQIGDDEWSARAVVLATGVTDQFPQIENFFTHYGADVFHCPLCDGYETQGLRVAVIGWSDEATEFAIDLSGWVKEVTVLTDGHALKSEPRHREALGRRGIQVIEAEAKEFVGERGHLEGVRLSNGKTIPCERAFFAMPSSPNNALALALGCRVDDKGYVVVDDEQATNIEGVFAAGDLTPGTQLVQLAAASGTMAGLAAANFVRTSDQPD